MHEGRHGWALLAAGPSEADSVEDMLAFGVLWLDWSRNHSEKRGIEGLRLFVPEGTSRSLREGALGLSSAAKLEIFEMREPDVWSKESIWRMRAILKVTWAAQWNWKHDCHGQRNGSKNSGHAPP
jgi:hypothetical protein